MLRSQTVLITGGSGLLALNWACAIRDSWDVILGTHRHSLEIKGIRSQKLNLDMEEQFGKQLDFLLPNLVVHTAGLTNVDECERSPNVAYQANAVVARNVAQATAVRNIPLIHISTDHLFSGDSCWYKEEDLPNPINEYAKTKLRAEEWILECHPKALCLRTNFFCWGHKQRQSFSDWLIYNMQEGKALTLFDDVFFTPILADKLVLVAHKLVEKGVSGVYHVVGDQRLSKYQFALEVCREFNFPVDLIQPGHLMHSPQLTIRPQDMSLNNNKVRQILGCKLGSVKDFLVELHVQDMTGRRQELLGAIY